jgi:prepilin-type N-terminal cleavage/methylation domain-containing protein
MNFINHPTNQLKKSHRRARGLTLIEMMITMGIFTFCLSAMVSAYIFGLRQDQLVQSKLGASDESRRSFQRVAYDIRSANSHAVGTYSSGAFTPVLNGTLQTGNAVRIFLSASSTNSIIYYFDTNGASGTWTLKRFHTGEPAPIVIATNLQNSCTFSAEDYTGAVQSSMLDKDVIHFTLDFCQYQYPLTHVGPSYYYDRYVVDFRATPHVPGGR